MEIILVSGTAAAACSIYGSVLYCRHRQRRWNALMKIGFSIGVANLFALNLIGLF